MRCHSYIFFDIAPSVHALDAKTLQAHKSDFIKAIGSRPDVAVESFATVGFNPGNRFLLHLSSDEASDIQDLIVELLHTQLGRHLAIVYTLFGLKRPSQYAPPHAQEKEEKKAPERKYLIVYPFTKTKEWHAMPFDERRAMMKEHVGIGHTFNDSIEQLLLYGYGVDDHEFILSYETDDLLKFQTLVMELRATKGRVYTESDTPLFLATRATLSEALDTI
jgi:chlorite dismutase